MVKVDKISRKLGKMMMVGLRWGSVGGLGGRWGEGQFDPPCGFSKNVSSKERVKPWSFVTFNIILKHIFPESFIEFPQVVQKI